MVNGCNQASGDNTMNVYINPFVYRQKPDSHYSYYKGYWANLLLLVQRWADDGLLSDGYKDGVKIVHVPTGFIDDFCSPVVELKPGMIFDGEYKARRKGEHPRKSFVVCPLERERMPTLSVEIVLYSSILLSEDDDNHEDPVPGNWEIVSINANPFEGKAPMGPDTLMHNHFGSDGGTATNMSDEEFVAELRKCFVFWKDKAMCG